MTGQDDASIEQTLRQAAAGNGAAVDQLLDRYRARLRQMVAARMDRRLASRLDASDVVQETLAEAAEKLSEYIRQRPAPFYLWLRHLAWQRLVRLSRRHIQAQRRSVASEAPWTLDLTDESVAALAGRLASPSASPSGQAAREEMRERVRIALAELEPSDRELLVLRYLEQLTTSEVANVLEITPRTVRSRHRRALERMGTLLGTSYR